MRSIRKSVNFFKTLYHNELITILLDSTGDFSRQVQPRFTAQVSFPAKHVFLSLIPYLYP